MIPLILAALLGLSGLMIVLFPLLGLDRRLAPLDTVAANEVADREAAAKEALREVEFDYRLGNLEQAEYLQLRERYERRALSALKTRYEQEQALDALIDQQLAELEAQTGTPMSLSPSPSQLPAPARTAASRKAQPTAPAATGAAPARKGGASSAASARIAARTRHPKGGSR